MTLDAIDKNEALRYLGCKENIDNERMISLLDECEKRLISAAAPKYLYEVFPIAFELGGVRISDSNIILRGNDAAEHLKNCSRIVLMCATLGQGVDVLLRQLQVTDMASAVTTDSLASAAVEQVCNKAEAEIFEKVKGNSRTWRFSPGYGDLPLDIQYSLLSILNAQKRIGLTVNDSNMMIPTKSVTAFIGLSDGEVERKSRGCESCIMKDKCKFRKSGGHCGN